jgi:hypothetical protein
MNTPITLPNPKVAISPVGLQITNELGFDEWCELATSIGHASRSIGFIVGDWLVYGQNMFGPEGAPERRVSSEAYDMAIISTGLDLSTLQNYAYVSRNMPFSLRNERLSWEHHRLMAKLPEGEQQDWIEACVAEAIRVEVTNLTGQVVHVAESANGQVRIATEGWAPAVYFVRTVSERGQNLARVTVQ